MSDDFAGGWNYRIVERRQGDVVTLTIHEVYYDADGNVSAWVEEPSAPYGEDDWSSLYADLTLMVGALDKPALDYDELPGNTQPGDNVCNGCGVVEPQAGHTLCRRCG